MKIIICDDQISEIQKLETLCTRYFQEKEIAAEIETTMNPKEILAEPLEADILILDVEMGEVNGRCDFPIYLLIWIQVLI